VKSRLQSDTHRPAKAQKSIILISNMPPSLTDNDMRDGRGSDAINSTQSNCAYAVRSLQSDLLNLLHSQFMLRIPFTKSASSFCTRIRMILGISPYEKMSRIYARRIVAAMTNSLTFWHWAMMKNPRGMRSSEIFPLAGESPDNSIAVLIPIPRPYPAAISLFRIFPEAICERLFLASSTAKTLRTVFCGLRERMINAPAS
jgi:hypothetical protein